MNWKDLGSTLGSFAPMLGTVIGGPAGSMIGTLVADALGVENKPEAVAKAMKADPQVGLKLKELELKKTAMLNDHIEKMAGLDMKYEELRVEDVSSARTREVEALKSGSKNYIQSALAIIGVLAFFGFSGYVVKYGLADMSKESAMIVGTVIGSVMMIGKDIYGYYFGSSSGSKEKTKMMKG